MTVPSGSDPALLPAAYILAGGASRRFGRDKARVEIDGRPLILHAAALVTPYARRIIVVAGAPDQYADLGLTTITDIRKGMGPIGGLHAALQHAVSPSWFALIACDWIGVPPAWLEQLLAAKAAEQVDANAVVFRGQRFEPTLGLYHTSISELVDGHIKSGTLDMQSLLADAETIDLPLPRDWSGAVNVNRPSDVDVSGGT